MTHSTARISIFNEWVFATALVPLITLGVPDSRICAQEVIRVESLRPQCQHCRIVLDQIGQIGGPSDTLGLISMDAAGMQVRENHVVVAPKLVPHVVAKYPLLGDGFPLAMGRRGGGPGEFRHIRAVGMDEEGRIRIFADGRETTLSTTGELLGTNRNLLNPLDVTFFRDGSYVASGDLPSRESAGYPLHRFGSGGTLSWSFGPEGRGYEFDGPGFARSLSPSAGGTFWAHTSNRYRIEHWDTTGALLRIIERDVPWFEPWERWKGPWEGTPPARLASVWEDSAGRLWTLNWVADEDFELLDREDIDVRAPKDSNDPYFDTVIEILDPEGGTVILSQRFDRMFAGFHPEGVLAGWDATAEGYQLFSFYRMKVATDP